MKKLSIGLIGAGTIGSGLIEILHSNQKEILERSGIELNLLLVCDTDPSRVPSYFKGEVVYDYKKITENPSIDIVVELVGGTSIAYEIVRSALVNKKTVVTANKALLSEKGGELFLLAEENKVEIGYEASVGGAIPVIRSIKTGLIANDFLSMYGILNGTTNGRGKYGLCGCIKTSTRVGICRKRPNL